MSWGTNPWQNAVRMAEGGAGSRVPRQPREGRRAGNSQRNPWAKTIKQQREKEWLRAGSTRPELGPKSVSGQQGWRNLRTIQPPRGGGGGGRVPSGLEGAAKGNPLIVQQVHSYCAAAFGDA